MRDQLNRSRDMSNDELRAWTLELARRIDASGRTHPVPKPSARAEARARKIAEAIEQQAREEEAVKALQVGAVPAVKRITWGLMTLKACDCVCCVLVQSL